VRLITIAFTIIFASPVAAQIAGTAREDCNPLYSVQKRNCKVEHVYRCETGQGVIWRKENYEPGDPLFVDILTDEGDLLEAWDETDGKVMQGIVENRDPVSLSELRGTGSDQFSQVLQMHFPMFVEPVIANVSGELIDMGETLEVDGVVFDHVRQTLSIQFNAMQMSGFEDWFVDRATGAIVFGMNRLESGAAGVTESGTPVQVIRPGEEGFLENRALYDCGSISDAGQELDEERKNA